MAKNKIKAVAILNESNPEFFSELLKKGVDAVEPEMKKQLKELSKNKETLNWHWEDRELEKCISLLLNNDLKDIEKYHIKAYYNSLLEDTTNDGLS
ncbi:MAG: hypothetical protein PHS54_07545 [Clostridia bacterium]|nr:hypothetical protein [Clostridia bacterium]